MYFVYIVECRDGTFYVGITTDLERRVQEHNSSRLGARYTRGRRPVGLRYFEKYETRSEASRREIEIKRMKRREKLGLVS